MQVPVHRVVLFVGLLAAACLLPALSSDYRVFQFTMVLIYAMALLGLNLLVGYSGQVSLGHGAFFAAGAYITALLIDPIGVPYWLSVPLAGVACGLLGFLFGLPALRLQGPHLALATFGLALAVPQLLKHKTLSGWTGGSQGLVLVKPDPPAWFPWGPDRWLYAFALILLLLMYAACWNLVRGRTGRALAAVRDHPLAAQALGVNTSLYKSLAFGISALYTGMAGGLSAIAVQFVSPDSFPLLLSIAFLVGITVGGIGTMSGALYGAVFTQFVPNVSEQISKSAPWVIYGVVLILIALLMPGGIAGGLRDLGSRWRARPGTPFIGQRDQAMKPNAAKVTGPVL